ncbi:MAG: DUF2911 domain-containing protein [Acidobacteria bacterium]|nr:MAG: DUF2911 domain-containing protein [Acidobacteriota bacterium]
MKCLKLTSLSIAAIAALSLGTIVLLAQSSRRGEASATIGSAHVSVDYGRPILRGRDPLSMLQSGQVWRLGANTPTTIDSDHDLLFGNTRVPKGKHILLAQFVEPGKWVLLASTKTYDEYDSGAKIAETPMKVENGQDSVNQLTIKLSANGNQGDLEVSWGTSRLAATFRVAE